MRFHFYDKNNLISLKLYIILIVLFNLDRITSFKFQAYVLYLFFALLLGYVSNGDEYALIIALEAESGPSSQIKLNSSVTKSGSQKMSSEPRDGAKFLR